MEQLEILAILTGAIATAHWLGNKPGGPMLVMFAFAAIGTVAGVLVAGWLLDGSTGTPTT